jgi:hypothetical protein
MDKKKKEKVKFLMDTDWVFQGNIDSEQKKYVLLNYFQKLNKNLEEFKIYPMFTELSLHLGNVQTLLNRNQILYTDKKFTSFDDELLMVDLKVKDIPQLNEDEFEEYQRILRYSQPKLFDYFNIVKSLWVVVNDKIYVNVKKNKKNIENKTGFFYFEKDKTIYVWRYDRRKVYKVPNMFKTKIELIYNGEKNGLTISEILSKFYETYFLKKEDKCPIFEIVCNDEFPMDETLVPLFKRKIMTYIAQSSKPVKMLKDGIQ